MNANWEMWKKTAKAWFGVLFCNLPRVTEEI